MLIIAESEKSLIYYTKHIFWFEIVANSELISKLCVNKLSKLHRIFIATLVFGAQLKATAQSWPKSKFINR
jgi:hypothetical protein